MSNRFRSPLAGNSAAEICFLDLRNAFPEWRGQRLPYDHQWMSRSSSSGDAPPTLSGAAQLDTDFEDDQGRRYPTRILAARAAYLDGVPLTRIVPVLSSSLKYEGDPGVDWWLKMMRSKSLAMPGSKEETQRAIKLVEAGQTKAIARPRVKAPKRK